MRNESLQKQYSEISQAPFYLFTFPILFAGLVLLLIYVNLNTQKEKAKFVADPKPGDVYTIRKDEKNSTSYYFLRLVRINGDSVFAYHNHLEYSRFISRLSDDDYFVKDEELYFTKSELKQMLDKAEIISVDRNYGNYESFDRIR